MVFAQTHPFMAATRAPVDAPAPPVLRPRSSGDLVYAAPWPLLGADALHGLAGALVRAIEPHTEADEANLLAHLLTMIGNAAGPAAHAVAEGADHPMRLFTVVVGDTASAKGSAAARVRQLMDHVDPDWARACVIGGLSSGEGLVQAVRDPNEGDGGEGTAGGAHEAHGAREICGTRRLAFESEFGGTLKVMGREGNTLSVILRQAWDGPRLAVMTRSNPLAATGAYLSVLGHVTPDELRRTLSALDSANGFANRFLWVLARRSKDLPDGEGVPHYGRLLGDLREALTYARDRRDAIRRDAAARALWHQVYPTLAAARPGRLGGIVSRARAQVLRLSVLYAMLDQSPLVGPAHLRAALAVWAYCEESAEAIFGGQGDMSLAGRILAALRDAGAGGLSRTEISYSLGRNVQSRVIRAELAALEDDGHVRHHEVRIDDKHHKTVFHAAVVP
jgi:hypothetical protein